MTSEQAELQHEQLARDASSLDDISDERAVKRPKTDNSTPTHGRGVQDQDVPGEGLHDAPPAQANGSETIAGNGANGNGDERSRKKGMAPIKKE
jgi:hypothetical protein